MLPSSAMAAWIFWIFVSTCASQQQQQSHPFTIEQMLNGDSQKSVTTANPANVGASSWPPHVPSTNLGSTTAPVNVGNVISSLLVGAGRVSSLGGESLSQDSMDVVNGLVEAFMHKVKLQPGEKSCIEQNLGTLAGDIMGTVQDIVLAIKAVTNTTKRKVNSTGAITSAATAKNGILSSGLDAAMKIASLVTLTTRVLHTCVHGDALYMLQRTTHHLMNAYYLGHRLLVNGIEILHCISDCIIAFEAHDFHRFGMDIGTALRKVLLSNANGSNFSALPEGVPEQTIIQQVTQGVMQGFFMKGSMVQMTDRTHPDVNIILDLHHCIAANHAFWEEIWMAVWNLIAKLALNGQQHGFPPQPAPGGQPVYTTAGQFYGTPAPVYSTPFGTPAPLPGAPIGTPAPLLGSPMAVTGQRRLLTSQPQNWKSELMVALMQLPMALERCGAGAKTQQMLMEAIRSLSDVQIKFLFPEDRLKAMKVTDEMAKAVKAWTDFDFVTFGEEIGKLLRELVMLAFPQKYSVDNVGRLHRKLDNPSMLDVLGAARHRSLLFVASIASGVILSSFVAAVAIRRMRPLSDSRSLRVSCNEVTFAE